jgi:uncharacterized protein
VVITYDPAKRDRMIRERGLDFEDAAKVFAGLTIDKPDLRRDSGERRINTVGHIDGRMVVVCCTPRGDNRRLISMRKANEREKARYGQRFEES